MAEDITASSSTNEKMKLHTTDRDQPSHKINSQPEITPKLTTTTASTNNNHSNHRVDKVRKLSTNLGKFPHGTNVSPTFDDSTSMGKQTTPSRPSRFSFLTSLRKKFLSGGDHLSEEEEDEEEKIISWPTTSGIQLHLPEDAAKIDTSHAKAQLTEFFQSRRNKDGSEAPLTTNWRPPSSWAVIKPVYLSSPNAPTTLVKSPDLISKLERMDLNPEELSSLWHLRVYRPTRKLTSTDPFASDAMGLAFTTVSVPLTATVKDIYILLAKKFCPSGQIGKQRLFLSHGVGDILLEIDEQPVLMQRRLFAQLGYRRKQEIDLATLEDYSYVCRFVFRELPTANTQWMLRYDVFHNRHGRRPSWFSADRPLEVTHEHAFLDNENLAFLPSGVFEHAETLQKVHLGGNPLLKVPEDLVIACKRLKALKLTMNYLRHVPTYFERFESLEHLDLGANQIDDAGAAHLYLIKTLKHLDLSGNQLTKIPKLPPHIVKVNVANNRISWLEVTTELLNVVDLDVSYNNLVAIPELFQLTKLRAKGNQLQHPFMLWPRLQYLDISDNVNLEGSMNIETPLVYLLADNTKITVLTIKPEGSSLIDLSMNNSALTLVSLDAVTALKRIDLSHNRLTLLAEDFFVKMPYVESICLDHNRLGTLPSLVECLQLKFLSVCFNQISDLGMRDALPALKSLSAQRNNLKKISRSVWKSRLEYLNLASNYLNVFPTVEIFRENFPNQPISLPDTLRTLILNDNQFKAEVFDQLAPLKKLTNLQLALNDIYTMPEDVIFEELTSLNLAHNQLSSLPDSISKFGGLYYLYLNGNRLTSLPGELGLLKNLQLIDVSNCNLRYNIRNAPYDWNWSANARTLQWLDLSGNAKLDIPSSIPIADGKKEVGVFATCPQLHHLNLVGVAVAAEAADSLYDCRVRLDWTEFPSIYPLSTACRPILYNTGAVHSDLHRQCIYEVALGKFSTDDTSEDLLVAMFDGHHSPAVSAFLYQTYPEELFNLLKGRVRDGDDEEIEMVNLMRLSFMQCNLTLSNQPRLYDPQAFSTAAVCFIDHQRHNLYVANLGDIQVYLLSSSHSPHHTRKPSDPTLSITSVGTTSEEAKTNNVTMMSVKHDVTHDISRMKDLPAGLNSPHQLLTRGNVSRAFGAFHLTPQVAPCPSVSHIHLDPDIHDYLVICSSAITLPDWQIADLVYGADGNVVLAAQRIRDLNHQGRSNVMEYECSVTVMSLKPSYAINPDLADRSSRPSTPTAGLYKRRHVREDILDNALARLPKEIEPPEDLVAMVFTDIRDSTPLWEGSPGAMRVAQKLHHLIMRRQLRIIGGYEVKTEGDAFMVAFPTAQRALSWCISIQRDLLAADWPVELLKTPQASPVYYESGEEVESENRILLFKGISVRMGLHYGRMESEVDPVTGRMDYHGVPVVIASRISSMAKGGQILMSESVKSNLTDISDIYMDCLGEQKLKGLEGLETVYAVYPQELALRSQYFLSSSSYAST